MKADIKERWVTALRSGKYTQGKGVLKNIDGSFCCLGVLCDIVKDDLGREVDWSSTDKEGEATPAMLGKIHALPAKVVIHTGILDVHGHLKMPLKFKTKVCDTLASLNDAGASFEEIAEVIEEQF